MAGSDLLNLAVAGMNAQRSILGTIGHNISNANTEGYSRQQVVLETPPPQFSGGGYFGTGVTQQTIRRLANDYVSSQLRTDNAIFNEMDTYLGKMESVDNLLADARTGMAPGMQQFFSALQTAANDPSSLPARQLVISQGNSLVDRFHNLDQRLRAFNMEVNKQVTSLAARVTALAKSIAEMNQEVTAAVGAGQGNMPNDLLDKRDKLLKELSGYIGIQTVGQDDGSVNVLISKGQALVVGKSYNPLLTKASADNPDRLDVGLPAGVDGLQDASDNLSGGQLGGYLTFRNEVLRDAQNTLGRLALGMADGINQQHALGMDLEGRLGGLFFSDINDSIATKGRVVLDSSNLPPNDRSLNVSITDTSLLTTSDYDLDFTGPANDLYVLRRRSDNEIVSQGVISTMFPSTISVDGFTINLVAGSFQAGDHFMIQPVHRGAVNMEMAINRNQSLALAAPLRTLSSTQNRGSGALELNTVEDVSTQAFAAQSGALSPPLLIRFNSATSYDILDNSDPKAPVALIPPRTERTFLPGVENDIFSSDSGILEVRSEGALAGALNAGANNGYPAETFTISRVDTLSGSVVTQTVNTALNASARTVADQLNAVTGLSANAYTRMKVGNIVDGGSLSLELNGQLVTGLSVLALASNINNTALLTNAGIRASTDGTTLTITSEKGDDLSLIVGGGVGDSVDVTDMTGAATTVSGGSIVTEGGVLEVEMLSGMTFTSTGAGLFTSGPLPLSVFMGYTLKLNGLPQAGDTFLVDYNSRGSADNRNALMLNALQNVQQLDGKGSTYINAYSQLVENIGTRSSQIKINHEASKGLLEQSQETRDSLSGVNLDEEAAKLLEHEMAYNASAQVVTMARSLFDTLLRVVGA